MAYGSDCVAFASGRVGAKFPGIDRTLLGEIVDEALRCGAIWDGLPVSERTKLDGVARFDSADKGTRQDAVTIAQDQAMDEIRNAWKRPQAEPGRNGHEEEPRQDTGSTDPEKARQDATDAIRNAWRRTA